MKRTDLIGINQAAALKGVSRQAIHAAIEDGRLKHVVVTVRAKRIAPEDLAAFQPDVKRRAAGLIPKRSEKD